MEKFSYSHPDEKNKFNLKFRFLLTKLSDGSVNISFDYDTGLVAAVKLIDGRRWQPQLRSWNIPESSIPQMIDLCDWFGIKYDTSVFSSPTKAYAPPPPAPLKRRIAGEDPEDWICSDCRRTNFSYRTACFSCEKERENQLVAKKQKIEHPKLILSARTDTKLITPEPAIFTSERTVEINRLPFGNGKSLCKDIWMWILSRIDLEDLLLNVRSVCKKWYFAVQSLDSLFENSLEYFSWKKSYEFEKMKNPDLTQFGYVLRRITVRNFFRKCINLVGFAKFKKTIKWTNPTSQHKYISCLYSHVEIPYQLSEFLSICNGLKLSSWIEFFGSEYLVLWEKPLEVSRDSSKTLLDYMQFTDSPRTKDWLRIGCTDIHDSAKIGDQKSPVNVYLCVDPLSQDFGTVSIMGVDYAEPVATSFLELMKGMYFVYSEAIEKFENKELMRRIFNSERQRKEDILFATSVTSWCEDGMSYHGRLPDKDRHANARCIRSKEIEDSLPKQFYPEVGTMQWVFETMFPELY